MNWDAIGAIGEIVGALAVVVSLIYLASQIKNQNRESRLAAMHEISNGFRAATNRMIEDDLGEIYVKALEDVEALDQVEKLKLIVAGTSIIRSWEEAYIQFDTGNLETRVWDPMTNYYGFILSSKPMSWVWSQRKTHFDGEFREYVDGLAQQEYSL